MPTTTTVEPTTVTEPNTTVAPVQEVVTMETVIVNNGTADNSTNDTNPEIPIGVVPSNEQTNNDDNQGNQDGSDVTGNEPDEGVEKFGVPLTETTSTSTEPPPIYSDNDSGIKIVELVVISFLIILFSFLL